MYIYIRLVLLEGSFLNTLIGLMRSEELMRACNLSFTLFGVAAFQLFRGQFVTVVIFIKSQKVSVDYLHLGFLATFQMLRTFVVLIILIRIGWIKFMLRNAFLRLKMWHVPSGTSRIAATKCV